MQRRRINVKLLVYLFSGVFVAALSLYLVHRFQMERNAGSFLAAAREKDKAGDMVEGAKLMKQYISLKPDDYDSYVEMGRMLASVADKANVTREEASIAYGLLDQYVIKLPQEVPQHAAFRRHCVDFGSKFGAATRNMVITHAGYLLAEAPDDVTDEQLVELNSQLARALVAEKDYDGAKRRYSQLVGFDYGEWGSQEFKLDPAEVDITRYKQDVPADDQRGEAAWNQALERWWGKGSRDLDAYSALASLVRLGNVNKAERDLADRMIDRMVEMNGDSFEAHLRRGQYLLSNTRGLPERTEQARAEIAKAQELEADNAAVLLAVSDLAIRDTKWSEAEAILDRAVEKYPADARMYQARSDVAMRQNQRDVAMGFIKRGLVAVPSSADLLLLKVDLELQSNAMDEVRKTIEEMDRVGVRPEILSYIEARTLFSEKKWIDAAKRFEEVRPAASSFGRGEFISQIDLFLGQCYEQMGQLDRAYEAYDRARISNAGLTVAREGAERMAMRSGRGRPAATATASTGASQAPQQDSIEKQMQQLKQTQPQLLEWEQQLVKADLHMRQGELEEAKAILLELAKSHADDMRVWANVIRLGMRDPKQNIEAVRAHYDTVRKRFADREFPMTVERFWIEAIDVVSRRENQGPAEALQLVDLAEKELGDTVILRQARAKLLALQGGDGLRDKLAALEEGVGEWKENEQLAFWLSMATIYYQVGIQEDARRCLQEFDSLKPDDLRIKLTLFGMALEAKDDAMIERTLEAIRKLNDPTSTAYSEAAHAAYMVRLGRLTADARAAAVGGALAKIEQVKALREDWPDIYRLEGDIHLLVDPPQIDSAIGSYRKALELGPADPAIVGQLVSLLSVQGRYGEANAALDLLPEHQRDAISPERLVQVYMGKGQYREAVGPVRTLLERDPRNLGKNLLAGQVLVGAARQADLEAQRATDEAARQAGRDQARQFADEGEAALRQAVELGPQVPETWLTLISLLTQTGKLDAAEAESRRAQLHLPEDRLPVVMAKVAELMRRPLDAERYYEAAILNQPNDSALLRSIAAFYLGGLYTQPDRITKANRYLNRMLALPAADDAVSADNLAWARRVAARVLASSGRHEDFRKAEKVMQADVAGVELPPENRLEWARILATRPEPARLRQAKQHLEQLAGSVRLGIEDRLLLAELQRRSDQWNLARDVMNRAITDFGSDPRVWATYCRMSLEQNELEAADNYLTRLESLAKESPVVVELKAKLLSRRGRGDEAAGLIEAMVPDPVTKDNLAQLRGSAALLVEMKQHAAAERLYRKMVEVEPRMVLALAEFLGRYGDLDEAFSLMEKHFNDQTAPTILGLATNVLAERRPEAQSRFDSQVEAWFEKAERANPGSKRLLLHKAILRDAQGSLEDVEVLYRELLARNSNTQTADDLSSEERAAVLNNLAFHLALRGKDVAEGKKFIDEAITILGETAELLDTRAMVLLAEGQHSRAIDDLNQSIFAGPSAQKLFHLALACEQSGDRPAALEALRKAEQLGLEESRLSQLERPKYEWLLRELGVRQARAA